MQQVCARCGWHNEPTAVMCGGCGHPLHAMRLPSADPSAITEPELPAVRSVPRGYGSHPAGYGAATPVAFPRASGVRGRAGGCLLRGLLTAVLVLSVLGALGWIAVIRPAVHRAVDASLRSQMIAVAQQVPTLDPGTYSVDAPTVTSVLRGDTGATSPISNPTVHFSGGRVILTFQLLGHSGAIVTSLVASDGRLVAQNTAVRGWLGLVESGPELQLAINNALAQLPAADSVRGVAANHDQLAITLG